MRAPLYRFGPFELKSQTGELIKSGRRVRLTEQSCRVLVMLLDRPGELVSCEELQQQLWSEGTSVDFDHGLNVAVTRLRQALSDNPEQIGVEEGPFRLTTDPLPDVSPAWSPNGRSIGFVRLTGTDTAEVVLIPSNSGDPKRRLARIASPSSIYKDL